MRGSGVVSAAIVWGVVSTDWMWFDDNREWSASYLWATRDGQFVIGAPVVEAPYGPVRLEDGGYHQPVSGEAETKVRDLIEDAGLTAEPGLFLVSA